MKKIVVSVISTDQVPELGDELREKCDESLAEFNVDIYHVIKKFGPVLAQMGVQQNHEKNLFLNETDSDFCISHPVYATPLRDFSTLVDAVNKEGIFENDKEDIDLVLLAGKESIYVDGIMYETNEGFLRAVFEAYCEHHPKAIRMYEHPVEYIQNILLSSAPYAPIYVPYTNEQGAFNNIIGYSRKFAELFKFREDINPNESVNNHDALMCASRNNLNVRYLRSQNFRERNYYMSDLTHHQLWEQMNDAWRTNMKRAIPKFTKNILKRKITFLE